MEELLLLAKKILDINPNACLTGTLMLKLRGIDLGREPKDIDILINDYATGLVTPDGDPFIPIAGSSDGCGIKYKFGDIIIDVLSDGELPELVDGIRLGTVQRLMDKKYIYSLQNNEEAVKHREDLVKLGFVFPEPASEKYDTDGLPF